MNLTYDVRIWNIRPNRRSKNTTYTVRWRVGGQSFAETFPVSAQAEGRRAELITSRSHGEQFDIETGLPLGEARRRVHAESTKAEEEQAPEQSWYAAAVAYLDQQWESDAANTRRSRAEVLTDVTVAVLPTGSGSPPLPEIRLALRRWAFNKKDRDAGAPPDHLATALAWIEQHSPAVSVMEREDPLVTVINSISKTQAGKQAAPTTVARKRAVLHHALESMVGRELSVNLLPEVTKKRKKAPKTTDVVDPEAVVNHRQARALLAAVAGLGGMGPHLVAFFACMYYAGLRPGEAAGLKLANLKLPEDGWGTIMLRKSSPTAGAAWTDTGARRDTDRQLKHRAVKDIRVVPCPPELTALIQKHIREFNAAPDGRLFRGARGGELSDSVYERAWTAARKQALTPAEVASPLARRPYDLRHACLSTWLNATNDPAQVAEWAGNSVRVLLSVYTKCINGRDADARRRIELALRET